MERPRKQLHQVDHLLSPAPGKAQRWALAAASGFLFDASTSQPAQPVRRVSSPLHFGGTAEGFAHHASRVVPQEEDAVDAPSPWPAAPAEAEAEAEVVT